MTNDNQPSLFPLPPPRRRSPAVTAEMAGQIKTLVWIEGWMQHDVAAFFKINQGRVSEVIAGKRFPEVPPLRVAM